jgi:antitoxin YefM
MAIEITYTHLRKNLALVLNQVVSDREVIIVRRRRAEDVALIPLSEVTGLMETAHLMRSPRNAARLL